jgi:hypothetical protein
MQRKQAKGATYLGFMVLQASIKGAFRDNRRNQKNSTLDLG